VVEALDFEAWYESISPDLGDAWSESETRKRKATLRAWLRDFYDTHGPVPDDVVAVAFILDQITLATENVAVVMPDIERTSGLRPVVEVDDYEGGVRISFNGGYTTPSVSDWGNPDALAEVADYLQEHVMDALNAVWPTRADHDFGLHAEVEMGKATWWCAPGGHPVALVGPLGQARGNRPGRNVPIPRRRVRAWLLGRGSAGRPKSYTRRQGRGELVHSGPVADDHLRRRPLVVRVGRQGTSTFLTPVDDSLRPRLDSTTIRFRLLFPDDRGNPRSMWQAWLGFNVSHGVGLLTASVLPLSLASTTSRSFVTSH
jgi:hypothetical protein